MIDDDQQPFTSVEAARRGVQVLLSIAEDREISVDQRIICATAIVGLPLEPMLAMKLDGDLEIEMPTEDADADGTSTDHRVRDDPDDSGHRLIDRFRKSDDG